MDMQQLIKAIDDFLIYNKLTECTPTQVSEWLDKKGILKDSKDRKGMPLRNILRKRKIPHAYQIGRDWHIPLSTLSVRTIIRKDFKKIQEKSHKQDNTNDYEPGTVALAPLVDEDSKILIMGTLPGANSLRTQKYYNNPSNQIWKILAHLFDEPLPQCYEEKKALLKKHHIGLWDVLHSAQRKGSLDSNITNGVPNNLKEFLNHHPNIKVVALNGSKAYDMFVRYFGNDISNIRIVKLLSSSSANTHYSELYKIDNWRQILE